MCLQPISLIIPNFCEDLERIDGPAMMGYEDDYEDDEGGSELLGVGELMSDTREDVTDNAAASSSDNNNTTSPTRITRSFNQLSLNSPQHRVSNGELKIPHSIFSLSSHDGLKQSAKVRYCSNKLS